MVTMATTSNAAPVRQTRSDAVDSPVTGHSTAYREFSGVIDALSEILARLEVRHVLACEGDGIPRLRVSAHPRRPEMQRETTETSNLDAFAAGKRLAHQFENMLDRELYIFCWKMFLIARD